MKALIVGRDINGEEHTFVLLEECFSEDDEPYTLFAYTNYYSASRSEQSRMFFKSSELAFEYCEQFYDIPKNSWVSKKRLVQEFHFEYAISAWGKPQPYLLDFENGETLFLVTENSNTQTLNISGNREGLRRLAAMLIICAESEKYDEFFHIHLEDKGGFILPDLPVILRSPSYFEPLIQGKLRDDGCDSVNLKTRT